MKDYRIKKPRYIRHLYKDSHFHIYNLYKCLCGKTFFAREDSVNAHKIKSCGYYAKIIQKKLGKIRGLNNKKHGHARHTAITPEYFSWGAMKQRCLNPKTYNYRYYGGRGIKICKRWLLSFENFLKDMGKRPKFTTLDRINVNGNYTPSNCRWATIKEQNNNLRRFTIT